MKSLPIPFIITGKGFSLAAVYGTWAGIGITLYPYINAMTLTKLSTKKNDGWVICKTRNERAKKVIGQDEPCKKTRTYLKI
jgi:hypothetical protein